MRRFFIWPRRLVTVIALASLASASAIVPARAAETTGTIIGDVRTTANAPLGNALVVAASPSGVYRALTDSRGHFALLGVAPDTYVVSVAHQGYAPRSLSGVTVAPGSRADVQLVLQPELKTIANVQTRSSAIAYGRTSDVFTVTGAAARGPAVAAGSGLASYTQGTVQAAIAAVPGVQQDQFANAIIRGGKVDDVVFTYDAVPVPQALIAEPGGNVIGAQLATTGVGYTSVDAGGYDGGADDALSAVVDQIPLGGVYPPTTSLELTQGVTPFAHGAELERRWATPDLRQRYAFDVRTDDEAIAYGDGTTFYPAEAATYGLSLSHRATWSAAANAHFALTPRDDLEVLVLGGEATYDQYGTPYAGQTYGAFDGTNTRFPGEPSPDAQVQTPSRVRGTYAIEKVQLLRRYDRAYARIRLYRSLYGAFTVAPFFDDLSFPNGVISYYGKQSGELGGFGIDVRAYASSHHELSYGAELRDQRSALDQVVPTFDETVTSAPVLFDTIGYLSDSWRPSDRVEITGSLRAFTTRVQSSTENDYSVAALDPHVAAAYRAGANALRVAYDHTTVPPKPLEADRVDSAAPNARFTPLAPERASSFEVGIQHRGQTTFALTYFNKRERDRIDVIPQNYRSTIGSDEQPGTGIGIPQNVGDLNAHGFELYLGRGALTLSATYVRAFSSSASQFGLNDLNAPAIAAGALFPAGYIPDFTALLSYRLRSGRVTVTPTLSYQSGYPYGNGRMVWTYGPNGQPELVPNDNNVNPGYNYYFLRDPSQRFNAQSNPYVATLGTNEGDDPNTLRSTPQLLVSLHAEAPIARHATLMLEVANLLGTSNATQLQGNPYLIGPPGYRGGNPAYARWYGQTFGVPSYTLGNGVPTNDGTSPAVPWTYGTGAYVPSSYPEARTAVLRLRFEL
ncbi:MAG: TonB-dependent receptor [Vulcanimicrobiaceae bacterium]